MLLNQSNNYTGDTIIRQGHGGEPGINSLGATTNSIVLDAISGDHRHVPHGSPPTDYTRRETSFSAPPVPARREQPHRHERDLRRRDLRQLELTKIGAGTMNLAATNTYNGGTCFNAGTTAISADNNLAPGARASTFDGATLRLDAAMTFSRPITMTAHGTIKTNGNDSTLSSVLTGNGNFTKSGAGPDDARPAPIPRSDRAARRRAGASPSPPARSSFPATRPPTCWAPPGLIGQTATAENNTTVSSGATLEISGNYNGARPDPHRR